MRVPTQLHGLRLCVADFALLGPSTSIFSGAARAWSGRGACGAREQGEVRLQRARARLLGVWGASLEPRLSRDVHQTAPAYCSGVVATSASETLRAVYIIYGLAPQLGLVAGVCRVAVGVPRRCFVFQLLRADVRVP